VDLRELEFMDLSAVSVLCDVRARAAEHGQQLIVAPGRVARRVLGLLGLDGSFDVIDCSPEP
jgi:anti-anti-sigma regulatory factor